MSENIVSETKLREKQAQAIEAAEAARSGQSSGHLVWKIVGGAALALVTTGIIASLHDIRRYIKIMRM
jgi:uncharacterized protein DUF6893